MRVCVGVGGCVSVCVDTYIRAAGYCWLPLVPVWLAVVRR